MASINYLGYHTQLREGETALDALIRVRADVDFSCKSGVCHRCLMRCLHGDIPSQASKTLPKHLQNGNYLLACQTRLTDDQSLSLAPKSPEDFSTLCVALTSEQVNNSIIIEFEPERHFSFRTGQTALISHKENQTTELSGILTGECVEGMPMMLQADLRPDVNLPTWLEPDGVFGQEFMLRGPFPLEPKEEAKALATDKELWLALDQGRIMREVLETFYTKVYADAQLAPFFERVTKDWVIGKQYAFMYQCITGEEVFIGERPRNSHHWMVISDRLLDHRQALMAEAMHEHGLPQWVMSRWERYEENYRQDIVKHKPWPKLIAGQRIDTEVYETTVLDEATVCDYCESEIQRGTEIQYHRRLGKVACQSCRTSPLLATSN